MDTFTRNLTEAELAAARAIVAGQAAREHQLIALRKLVKAQPVSPDGFIHEPAPSTAASRVGDRRR